MAFGRLERSASAQPMSDINMTPLIDVMLVLLVIFMITAPLMTISLKLDLPRAEGAKPTDAPQFVTLAIDPQGRFFWATNRCRRHAAAARARGRGAQPGHRGATARRQERCPTAAWPS